MSATQVGLPRLSAGSMADHISVVPGKQDEVANPLYDTLAYPAAGTNQLIFFAQPIGQGATTAPGAAGTKTEADTNMTNAGLLPAGNQFFVTGIEFHFWPGVLPGQGAAADNLAGRFWNDVWTFLTAGWVRFRIQNRDYALDGPTLNFPPTTRLAGVASITSTLTAGAATMDQINYAAAAGAPYHMVGQTITSNQAFSVQLNYPALVALPSTTAARVQCRLRGRFIRSAQ
jgi:hypothetical protein